MKSKTIEIPSIVGIFLKPKRLIEEQAWVKNKGIEMEMTRQQG